ncbi:Serine hydrolase FSH [Corchorus olitorius]|uniref:Serine hydrolase FSH n=1 Tax=Corchorus olitorius TaxID=93759 RepID=A0A1R3IK21_9ROSI|nr:Serine hydrolase FSH [Corchorus olitorius]
MESEKQKMKILCLHGFRTSGKFLQKQISKWDPSIFIHFDMDFPDGIFAAGGKSEIEGIFPPPYFEWFQFNKDFTEYTNLDQCISHLWCNSLCSFVGLPGTGDKDWLKLPSEELATAFDNPLIIRHPQGHTVPRLDETSTQQLHTWITNILPQSNNGISNNKKDEQERPKELNIINDQKERDIAEPIRA